MEGRIQLHRHILLVEVRVSYVEVIGPKATDSFKVGRLFILEVWMVIVVGVLVRGWKIVVVILGVESSIPGRVDIAHILIGTDFFEFVVVFDLVGVIGIRLEVVCCFH